MKHLRIGGSTAARTLACPKWLELADKMPPQKSNHFADEGNLLHDAMEDFYQRDIKFIDQVGKLEYEGIVLTKAHVIGLLKPAYLAVESVFDKYGIVEYTCEPFVQIVENEQGGSIDMLGVNASGDTVLILDYKFGAQSVEVESNKQLLFYALAAKTDKKTKRFFQNCKKLVLAIVQPKVSQAPAIYETSLKEVEDFHEKLNYALDNRDIISVGSHCKYCPAEPICPAKKPQIPNNLQKLIDKNNQDN